MGEHRCTADRRKVAEALSQLLPEGWAVAQRERGDGTGHLEVGAPDGWVKVLYSVWVSRGDGPGQRLGPSAAPLGRRRRAPAGRVGMATAAARGAAGRPADVTSPQPHP